LLKSREATVDSEYTTIHFHLQATKSLRNKKSIYIYGAFNNYAFTEENRLKLNHKTNYFETEILCKQGFYNYIHVLKKENDQLDMITIDGSYQETENNYTILVYYQPFGERTQQIVGYSIINSKN
jgi:hypothetical protein